MLVLYTVLALFVGFSFLNVALGPAQEDVLLGQFLLLALVCPVLGLASLLLLAQGVATRLGSFTNPEQVPASRVKRQFALMLFVFFLTTAVLLGGWWILGA